MRKILAVVIAIIMLIGYLPVANASGEAKITGIEIDGQNQGVNATKKMPKSGGKLEVKVYTENIETLQNRAKKDGQFYQANDYTTNFNPNVKKENGYFVYNCTVPKNTTDSDVVWTIEFKADKWSTGGKIKVTVSGTEDESTPGEEPKPNPNPGGELVPEPNPNPGEQKPKEKAKLLGFIADDGSTKKEMTDAIDYNGKTYNIKLDAKGMNVDTIKKLSVFSMLGTSTAVKGFSYEIKPEIDGSASLKLVFKENATKEDRKYKITVSYNFEVDSILTFNITVKGNPDAEGTIKDEAKISLVSDTEDISHDVKDMYISPNGEEKNIYITLINGSAIENSKITAEIKKGESTDQISEFYNREAESDINYEILGDKTKKDHRVIKIKFPENNTGKAIKYQIIFSLNGKAQNSKRIYVNQEAKKGEKLAKVDIFSLTNENIPLGGGKVTASAFGENFDVNKFSLKVFEGDNDITNSLLISKFTGREDVASVEIEFKKSESEKTYTIKLYYDGKEVGVNELKQNENGSNNDSIDIQANRVIKVGNKIITEFAHDVFEAYPGALKENTEIAFDGSVDNTKHESKYVKPEPTYEKLKVEDTVEVIDNKIIVTLNEEKEFKNTPKIRYGFRTFKNPSGVYNGRKDNQINSYFIQDGKGIILSAEFISDDVFLSNGGEVELKIKGLELTDDEDVATHTRAKIFKMQNLVNEKDQKLIDYTITGKGNEQTLKFKVPENKSNRTESYTIALSTDGRVYLSNVNATINDRANLLVVSVLPVGKNKDDMTLGFARIQSYGTNGGSKDAPNITHTVPPLGQESKKTWVTIYGTNLKNPMTKIRAKAEVPAGSGKYVYWYPVNEGTQDSGNKFIMVGVSKGLYGSGNVQMLEVIAPRGYRGDITYIYEVAIDGENYDEELTTTVLLKDDGEDGGIRKKHEDYVRDLTIKYQDTEGNEIKPSETKYVMKNMQLKVVGIDKAPEIKGYKYKELKGINKDLQKELSQIDMLKELQKNGTITEEQKEELKRLELVVKNHKNIEFDSVIEDIPELIFVYKKIDEQKPVEPTPQPQPEPQPPYYGGAGYYEPSPDYLNKDYAKKEDKKEIKKDEKKEEKNIEEVKEEKKVITTKFTLDNKNFASNDMTNMMDVEPFAKDGRIMVPIRFVGMALGFDVSWDQATKTATLTNGKITIKIPMNGKTFYVNDVAYDADAEPEVRHDRIFLSISNIAKALGLEEGKEIFWDQETKTATFIYNK